MIIAWHSRSRSPRVWLYREQGNTISTVPHAPGCCVCACVCVGGCMCVAVSAIRHNVPSPFYKTVINHGSDPGLLGQGCYNCQAKMPGSALHFPSPGKRKLPWSALIFKCCTQRLYIKVYALIHKVPSFGIQQMRTKWHGFCMRFPSKERLSWYFYCPWQSPSLGKDDQGSQGRESSRPRAVNTCIWLTRLIYTKTWYNVLILRLTHNKGK